MTGIVDWAASHARTVLAFIAATLVAGGLAYTQLPKEGEPDIDVPALFISVPFPGISAEDAESLLIEPMEDELADLDGLETMTATASENFAGIVLEFEFGWDATATMAEVRDRMDRAAADFPDGYERYQIDEFNFSEFPIQIVSLSGDVPERTLLRAAREMQRAVEGIDAVLEAEIAGQRDEMLEVIVDPLKLEAYNLTAGELINVVSRNNQLVAAGELETEAGAFSVSVPSSYTSAEDVYSLPVRVRGDSVVTMGDIADIRLTFEDREGTARFNGEPALALQVVMRKGFNQIDTASAVRETVAALQDDWPEEMREAITVRISFDRSRDVEAMVSQLEGSVLTAVALVMIVVLGALGVRPAMLVGFAIPTSFFLCFLLLGAMGVAISNIVMFGLILAVGILVDSAVVVVEYADKRINEGYSPTKAYVLAAKRMFWPIIASTATTLSAFLPMLFWPGVAGEFMGMLPVTLIFVLCASLVVALLYLPVIGGVTGRLAQLFAQASDALRALPWLMRALCALGALWLMFAGAMQTLNPAWLTGTAPAIGWPWLPGVVLFGLAISATAITLGALQRPPAAAPVQVGHRRTLFGRFIGAIVRNPLVPVLVILAVAGFVVATFNYYGANNRGVEFFVDTEAEDGIVYVRARGNLSLSEKDALVREAERVTMQTEGVAAVFAFAGEGGLSSNTGGASAPLDTIGQVQFEFTRWQTRAGEPGMDGNSLVERLEERLAAIPGIETEILIQTGGPGDAKPVHLRLRGQDLDRLAEGIETVRARFEQTEALFDIDDTRRLPGIEWRIEVDRERAGRFGTDVGTVGGMVQMLTRGILLDTMRPQSADDEIDIRARFPAQDRLLDSLDTLRLQTEAGLVPLSNVITRTPVAELGQIERVNGQRYLDVRADVRPGLQTGDGRPINANERIETLSEWLESEQPLPAGIEWSWEGDQQDQQESTDFLITAFAGALALMFIILLAQFNSFYNSVLVLVAVVLSTTGVLIGMLVMDQTFSIIMTGTGIVSLAGIVVNNNIVLIDTYQQYARYMPRLEAIVRTAEARIRPVLLTSITTIAALTPMMLGISVDFANGGYSVDSPTALWWKQLATAVVFGLGIATLLTLVFTPSLLAVRVWAGLGAYGSLARLRALSLGPHSAAARDLALQRELRAQGVPLILWEPQETDEPPLEALRPLPPAPLRAAE